MRELTLPGRLILLPGLGSTPAVFDHQRKAFGDRLETPAFIPHEQGESVAAYAQRWARQLSRPNDDRPLFIGGVSFGGMLAQEMAMHLDPKPRAVLLISTTREPDKVTGIMQLAELLGRAVPTGSVNKSLPLMKLAFAMREGLDDDDKGRLMQGARDVDPAMTKWASGVAVGWPGFKAPSDYPPVHQVHSKKDWVIKAPSGDVPNVELVDGSEHLLHMTQPTTVNRFLFEHVLEHCPEADVEFPDIEDPHTTAQRRATLEGAPAGTPLV
ncbi:MAG: alpha/beta hydrolase [Phycisphaeraceae bacterium]|nr:alpha/beta hydrolase [Phycisphaeraceae bacterium]